MFDDKFVSVVTRLFNKVFLGNDFPRQWNKSIVSLLYKGKGGTGEPSSYRGIALSHHLLKIYESILTDRLVRWINAHSPYTVYQSAYRKNRGVDEQIFILTCIKDDCLRNKKKLYICTIDLKRAFPSIVRALLFLRMREIGGPNALLNAFYNMYKCDEFSLVIDGEYGDFFGATSGVKEGAISSPILFTLFFDTFFSLSIVRMMPPFWEASVIQS
jgi:hypothetical protein